MMEIKGDMTCEEKLRFWKEAAWFWRKEVERMEKKGGKKKMEDENDLEVVIRRLMYFELWRTKNDR